MRDTWTRRQFLSTATASLAALNSPASFAQTSSPLRGRFLTHISIVRVNQIEVTPTRNLGLDEAPDNTPARILARRNAFARGCAGSSTGGRMTWAISWLALNDQRQQYKDARRLLASFHDRYNDEITYIPGGYFAPMFDTREHNRQNIHKALNMVTEMVGNNYRPQSLIAGFMDSENQRHLANDEGIHVCQGQIWSQHGIDNGDGDGGICYPYYPSREHYLKPAQDLPGAPNSDFIDSVCLDGWTCDFLTARREGFEGGFNSRVGVGPIETVQNFGREVGRKEMMDTTAVHFDTGHAANGFGWVTAIWETSLGHDEDLTYWLQTIHDRWPDTQAPNRGRLRSRMAQIQRLKRRPQLPLRRQRHRRTWLRKEPRTGVVHEQRIPPRPSARLADQLHNHGHRLHPLRPPHLRTRKPPARMEPQERPQPKRSAP